MLRNQVNSKLLKYLVPLLSQQSLIHKCNQVLCNKNTNIRQGKIMGKLIGNRVSGSKKHWFPPADSTKPSNHTLMFQQSQFSKPKNVGGKNATRRMAVLNKLFMKHITDLMATGEISEKILGKGIQISRVKISQDFAFINILWLASGEQADDVVVEHELQRCTGLLRHELSQLGLMGEVPRLKFVKDKFNSNLNRVESLLRNMDFSTASEEQAEKNDADYVSKYTADSFNQEFYEHKTEEGRVIEKQESGDMMKCLTATDGNLIEMRHDVLGLNHKDIMLKILTKMRKSKHAWDQHLQDDRSSASNTTNSSENPCTTLSTSSEQLNIKKILKKPDTNSENFEAFLAKRKHRKITPERKKFKAADHHIDDVNPTDNADYNDLLSSTSQRKLSDTDDFLHDELDERK